MMDVHTGDDSFIRRIEELRRKPTCMWCAQPFLPSEIDAHEQECVA